ncbi:SHOCT domain-containing protein [Hymenobacter negativus]|uniref:SHOCT domain-containing protein n=1 Tax=Hymenobacter negativus TaxID=2795026 RepID=A0ABS3QF47_9BACT|nr:SHOCT domain-containing protein [Hymenobacter negativus]MBO2009874.1 SHOCT domain-containing protein [Hymenobacter negativus]
MDNNPSSPLDTLRQLKEMLDAGALTPAEFDALKQRLVLNPGAPLPPAAPVTPVAPMPAVVPPVVLPPVVLPPAPAEEPHSPMFEDVADEALITPSAPVATPETPRSVAPEAWAPTAVPTTEPDPKWTGDEFPPMEETPARNPLALILSIGGVLVFLAVVAYLTLNRPPSEHISSTSQTAADSVAATIDTGPQAEQLPAVTATPETIRVAPAHPAPVIQPRPAPAVTDSVAAPAATDSAVSQ